MNQDRQKQRVAQAALEWVESGLPLGVGTGSTANCFIDALAASEVRPSVTVASSEVTAARLRDRGLRVVELQESGLTPLGLPYLATEWVEGTDLARFVELANLGAKEQGFADVGQLWRSRYDMTPVEFEAEAGFDGGAFDFRLAGEVGVDRGPEGGEVRAGAPEERRGDAFGVVEEGLEEVGAGEFLVCEVRGEALRIAQGVLHFDGEFVDAHGASGIGYRVSGVGCRVSGVGCRVSGS